MTITIIIVKFHTIEIIIIAKLVGILKKSQPSSTDVQELGLGDERSDLGLLQMRGFVPVRDQFLS